MAIVVLPEGQQRSGKQGGIVWSHNRGGPYIRNRGIPTNPNTDRQVVIRNAVRALTIAWQLALTQLQREAWDLYAHNVSWKNALGQSISLTGLNHYVRSNVVLLQSGIARIDDAPDIFDLAAAELALSATASEATQQLTIAYDDAAAWADETSSYQFVTMGRPQNANKRYFGGPWRLIGVIIGVTGAPPPSPAILSAAWPIAEGQRIWIQTRIGRADGRLSEFARYNFLCDA